jgi:hypothetical protein
MPGEAQRRAQLTAERRRASEHGWLTVVRAREAWTGVEACYDT